MRPLPLLFPTAVKTMPETKTVLLFFVTPY